MKENLSILIVEDEPPVARYIARLCRTILGDRLASLEIQLSLRNALSFLETHSVDLCLLDLNLRGKSGYELLKRATAGSFHTIIISAHTDQAVEAFKYGVLDFVPKPFEEHDLKAAFDRYFNHLARNKSADTQFLCTKKGRDHYVFSVDDVMYFKSADVYVEAYLYKGQIELLSKTMDKLEQLLPSRFFRIHRSYIVKISEIQSFTPSIQGACQVRLNNNEILPMSRRRLKDLQSVLGR